MQKLLSMLFLALDFAPGYKRPVGALLLAAAGVATAYNAFVAPQFGLPVVPADVVAGASATGGAVLGVGVAAAGARK